jgi:hypothetical protein
MKLNLAYFATILIAACACPAGAGVTFECENGMTTGGACTGGGIPSELPKLGGGWLVSAAEALDYQGQQGFDEPPALRARAPVPLIDILQPEPVADLRVKAPFTITVLFKSQPDTVIDPATFRVLYGAFKLDITSRITKYVTVTKEGFSLVDAKIPAGSHRLILQVQDEKHRMAERELRLVVD